MYHAVSVFLSDSQFGASGSPIGSDLFRTGDNRPLCQDPVNAVLLSLLEIPLDQAILEAMEADHGQKTVLFQQSRARSQQRFQVLQLMVDSDAQRLKRPGRRVLLGLGL